MKTIFEVKKEHLTLLKHMFVGWQDSEFGAPEIDPKRPFGNSDVIQDMIEIFGLKEIKKGIFKLNFLGKEYLLKGEDKYNIDMEDDEELEKVLNKLYRETETVLQIVLNTGQFKEGKYQLESEYGINWTYLG
jgi:hypothetical protein